MFNKVLIANRGEIACRIIRTCQRLGIQTVAIYSTIDRDALHVKKADEAYHVGPNPSRESYLNIDKIIEIAKKAKVNAIHPGYGFLSENAEFAKRCEENAISFIGPPSSAILAMGAKIEAKKIMAEANVPLVPGYNGDNQDKNFLLNEAKKIGFPILIKPSAGGGGKGMRVVEHVGDFNEALESAIREAKSSFNDASILIEKYLKNPRHIEIQIFADNHGNVVYLFERDCSAQRRHQKIIEEAPATHLSEQLRKEMGEAAVRAAKAINYRGAGTIEFLYLDKQFYFMEMNTRLQVEHPVTEMICGVDLVEWQIRVASNKPLPCTQDQIKINGHAIETRIYAEDPDKKFIPSVGKLTKVTWPIQTHTLRIDTGVETGSVISQFYDPMIAKVIVHAQNRDEAIKQLSRLLFQTQLVGIHTNIQFLTALLNNKDFINANIHTQFVDQELNTLLHKEKIDQQIYALASVYLLLFQRQAKSTHCIDPFSPWKINDHWRLFTKKEQTFRLIYQEEEKTIHITLHNDSFSIKIDGNTYDSIGSLQDNLLEVEIDGHQFKFNAFSDQSNIYLNNSTEAYQFQIVNPQLAVELNDDAKRHMNSPMPGTVVAIYANKGEKVEKGKKLMVIEAMKMEHAIHAPDDGVVKELYYKVGDMVEEGVELLSFEEQD
jgi:3-methylcrotonyl-CoA carboxylase alpha subunit